MHIDTINDIDSMPTQTKLQVIQDILDHPKVIQQLPLTTQKLLQQLIQSVAANKDAIGLLPKRTQASVLSLLTPRKRKNPPKPKKKLLTKRQRSIICKRAWKRYLETHEIVRPPKMQHLCVHIRQETQDILAKVKAKSECATWNETLRKVAEAIENVTKIDRSPRSTAFVPVTRFIRLDKSLMQRLADLHLGDNNDEILYVAAREYLKLKP